MRSSPPRPQTDVVAGAGEDDVRTGGPADGVVARCPGDGGGVGPEDDEARVLGLLGGGRRGQDETEAEDESSRRDE